MKPVVIVVCFEVLLDNTIHLGMKIDPGSHKLWLDAVLTIHEVST